VDNHNNIASRGGMNGRNTGSAEAEPHDRQRDMPVKSWDAYRDWCKRVRDSWHDDHDDKPPQLFG